MKAYGGSSRIFANNDIRFIAINNGVDSINGTENDMTPFINIFNEFYAKDTSRKIKGGCTSHQIHKCAGGGNPAPVTAADHRLCP